MESGLGVGMGMNQTDLIDVAFRSKVEEEAKEGPSWSEQSSLLRVGQEGLSERDQ